MSEPTPPVPLPLAAASARLGYPKGRPRKISPDLVIGMKAAGVPSIKIAEVLGVNQNSIGVALNRTPDAHERIAHLREQLKLTKIEHANRIEGRMWARLEKEVDGGEAKDVDAMARALLASEKIQAGVSGEGSASGAPVPTPAAQDIKILIQQLLS